MALPITGIAEIVQNQANKHLTHNEALRDLESLMFRALSRTTTAEPGAPTNGDVYIIPAAATGTSWGTYTEHDIAVYNNDEWDNFTPWEGARLWINDEDRVYVFDGSTWVIDVLLTLFGTASLTAGAIPFVNSTTNGLTFDTTNLLWEDTINELQIGDVSTNASFKLSHLAASADSYAFQIAMDAAGIGDVKAIDINYDTGALGAGKSQSIYLIDVNTDSSLGGNVAAMDVSKSAGTSEVWGLQVGSDVNALRQRTGTLASPTTALVNGVSQLTALTTSDPSGPNNISIFSSNGDTVTIGNSSQFEEIRVSLETVASGAGIKPTFEYSTGTGTWASFTPVDGTNGMRNDGTISWDASDLSGWATGTGGDFLIRITRTQASLSTVPVEDRFRVSELTTYYWDKDGVVYLEQLGVKNAAPGSMLHVGNNSTGAEVQLNGLSGTSNNYQIGTINGNYLNIGRTTNEDMIVLDANGNMKVGGSSPLGRVHASKGSSGVVSANASGDCLVVEDDADNGISILTPSANIGSLFFGDQDDNFVGGLRYAHPTDILSIFAGNATRMTIDGATGNVGIGTQLTSIAKTTILKSSSTQPALLLSPSDTTVNQEVEVRIGARVSDGQYGSSISATTHLNSTLQSNLLFKTTENTASPVERVRIDYAGRVSTGGESAPDVDAGGICVNHGANDGYALTIKNSDVAHSMTTYAQADTYGSIQKVVSNDGGLRIDGYTETTIGLRMVSFVTTPSTSDTGSGAIDFLARKYDGGTGVTSLASNEVAASFSNDGSVQTVIKANGDIRTQGGISTGGESSPDVDTGGICINHGADDGIALSIKNSDVSHPFTSSLQADTYFAVSKNNSTAGGALLAGLSSSGAIGLNLYGYSSVSNAGATTSGNIQLNAIKSNGGTGTASLANNENALSISNNGSVKVTVKGNGDIVSQGGVSTGGESSPDVDTGGICINHGADDGYALTIKNSDVAHPFTAIAQADTYLGVNKSNSGLGGADLQGFSEASVGIRLVGNANTANTSDTASGPIEFLAYKTNGSTNRTLLADTENMISFNNGASSIKAVIKGNGDIVTQGGIRLSGGADLLDTYEEGTWTPVIADASSGGNTASFTTVLATYTRVGRQVMVNYDFSSIDTTGMTAGNSVFFRGLPFTSSAAIVGICSPVNITFSEQVVAQVPGATSYFNLVESPSAGARSTIIVSDLTSGSAGVRGTVTYYV